MEVLMYHYPEFAWKWSRVERKAYRTIFNDELGRHRWREKLLNASEDILIVSTCRKMGDDLG